MEIILLAGHGSPKGDANNLEHIAGLLHGLIHPGCEMKCVRAAYLQFAKPDIMEAVENCISDGAEKVVVHPYFLSSGMHVTKDIPEIIRSAEKMHPDVRFVYTAPLGIHSKIAQVVLERIRSASGLNPDEIERRSFEIISGETDMSDIPEGRLPIMKRVVHATADFEFRSSLMFHPDAIKTGIAAIRSGKDILTDIEMVKTGINKRLLSKWGGKIVCGMQSTERRTENIDNPPLPPFSKGGMGEFVPEIQNPTSKIIRTRAEIGIESALRGNSNIGIIAIGNAPTALLKTIEALNNSKLLTHNSELLVVGVPVGFVKALESKSLLAQQEFPFITNISRKGGSTVAVAIINALLKMAEGG